VVRAIREHRRLARQSEGFPFQADFSDIGGIGQSPRQRRRTRVGFKGDVYIQRDRDGGVVSALPDSAYVTEIRLEKENLRIVGLADDAPGLLAPLEKSKHMTDVRFFAPMARGPDGKTLQVLHRGPRSAAHQDRGGLRHAQARS